MEAGGIGMEEERTYRNHLLGQDDRLFGRRPPGHARILLAAWPSIGRRPLRLAHGLHVLQHVLLGYGGVGWQGRRSGRAATCNNQAGFHGHSLPIISSWLQA